MAAVLERLDEIEIGLCKRINRAGRRNTVRRFFATVSRLGDGAFWIALALTLIALDGVDGAIAVVSIALTGGVCTLVYKTLKQRFVRERPFVSFLDIDCVVPPLDRYSFPSGHTLHAVAFAVLFTHAHPMLGLAAVPFTLLIAMSRVVLGLHYPSDVLAGAVIGGLLALTSLALV